MKLKPSNTSYIRNQMVHHGDEEEWKFGGDGEELSDFLNIGESLLFLQKKTMLRGRNSIFCNIKFQNSRSQNHVGM